MSVESQQIDLDLLCYDPASPQARDFATMRDLARERGDALSYAAAAILGR